MNNLLQRVMFLAIIFLLSYPAYAGEFYICVDKDGNETLTNTVIAGMKCTPKVSSQEPSREEGDRKEYIRRRATITERERAITDQEKAKADQERAKAQALLPKTLNKECERECKMDRSSCESDCNRNTTIGGVRRGRYYDYQNDSGRADCHMNCLNYQKSCIGRCYY